jgi:hypothetical protein
MKYAKENSNDLGAIEQSRKRPERIRKVGT